MMKNLMRGRHKDYIKYHASNVIELDEEESEQSHDETDQNNSSDSSSDDAFTEEKTGVKKAMRDTY